MATESSDDYELHGLHGEKPISVASEGLYVRGNRKIFHEKS
jgi:hypothetical protein